MIIAVGSAFRNAAGGQVTNWLNQVAALKQHAGPKHEVRGIAVEGDSIDSTYLSLSRGAREKGVDLDLRVHNHGFGWFGSTEDVTRMRALSGVANEILDGVYERDDVLVYVESDLLWEPHGIGTLIDAAMERREGFDVFSPLVFAGEAFYDIWGFRKDGRRFEPFPPYHPDLAPTGLTEIDSAGSCLVMRGEVARDVRIENGGALIGWCASAREKGYRLAVWPEIRIFHPV